MLTAGELRRKRRKRRRIVVFVFLLVIVIAAGYFGGRPAMNAIKGWQARRHAQKAFGYIDKEKWLEARNEATAAYQLRATEPQALRAVARFLSRTRQVEALDFWKQLQDQQPLTREDRRDEAAIAIMAAETTRADAALRELMAAKPEPADWLLWRRRPQKSTYAKLPAGHAHNDGTIDDQGGIGDQCSIGWLRHKRLPMTFPVLALIATKLPVQAAKEQGVIEHSETSVHAAAAHGYVAPYTPRIPPQHMSRSGVQSHHIGRRNGGEYHALHDKWGRLYGIGIVELANPPDAKFREHLRE